MQDIIPHSLLPNFHFYFHSLESQSLAEEYKPDAERALLNESIFTPSGVLP